MWMIVIIIIIIMIFIFIRVCHGEADDEETFCNEF